MNALASFNKTEVTTIRSSIARDLNNSEFDVFMQNARQSGLDPFRGQIIPMVFSAGNAQKRKMTMVISRDGLRCIAARCGDYRPATKPPEIVYKQDLKGPLNPLGIEYVNIELYKQDKSGEWWPVAGQAYWDEFAPVKEIWAYDDQQGKRAPTGKFELDPSKKDTWGKMGRIMIAKCAEAQALRAGWPEQFGGYYVQEEMDAAQIKDITPSEMAQQGEQEQQALRMGHLGTIPVTFTEGLQLIPVGQYHNEWMKTINEHKDNPSILVHFFEQNREGLRNFFTHDKAAAMDLKTQFERLEKQLQSEQSEQAESA